jgi:hypothetical protein
MELENFYVLEKTRNVNPTLKLLTIIRPMPYYLSDSQRSAHPVLASKAMSSQIISPHFLVSTGFPSLKRT